jgi:hypothetical protein
LENEKKYLFIILSRLYRGCVTQSYSKGVLSQRDQFGVDLGENPLKIKRLLVLLPIFMGMTFLRGNDSEKWIFPQSPELVCVQFKNIFVIITNCVPIC